MQEHWKTIQRGVWDFEPNRAVAFVIRLGELTHISWQMNVIWIDILLNFRDKKYKVSNANFSIAKVTLKYRKQISRWLLILTREARNYVSAWFIKNNFCKLIWQVLGRTEMMDKTTTCRHMDTEINCFNRFFKGAKRSLQSLISNRLAARL